MWNLFEPPTSIKRREESRSARGPGRKREHGAHLNTVIRATKSSCLQPIRHNTHSLLMHVSRDYPVWASVVQTGSALLHSVPKTRSDRFVIIPVFVVACECMDNLFVSFVIGQFVTPTVAQYEG